jgi:hypothetical protein
VLYPDWCYAKSWGTCLVRRASAAVILLTVETGTAHLRLAIDVDSDPISGSVCNGTGDAKPFSGWIELVSVIEAARRPDPRAAADERSVNGVQTLGSFPGAKCSEL